MKKIIIISLILFIGIVLFTGCSLNKSKPTNYQPPTNNNPTETNPDTNTFLKTISENSIDDEFNIIIGKIDCETISTLSENEIISIAKSSKLKKPNDNEWWEITYSSGSRWRTNPFDDKCIWVVRHYTYYNGGDVFSIAGDNIFIKGSNGEIGY